MTNILQVNYSNINEMVKREILDGITGSNNKLGKKENNYWIIKTNNAITGSGLDHELQNLNNLLGMSSQIGYTDVMIIDK